MGKLPPIFYHYFRPPLPYAQTLALQERIHQIQSTLRKESSNHKDYLLLLQHRPVFTSGRRQTEEETREERLRLTGLGADFVAAERGGQITYHGPGQIVGYPLLDLGRTTPPTAVRDYVCKLEKFLKAFLRDTHGIDHVPSTHTGVFLDERTKVASIGVQVRHRLTMHGFAMNISPEPLPWFATTVACGLTDVQAGCIDGRSATANGPVRVEHEIPELVKAFGLMFGRDMAKAEPSNDGEVGKAIMELETLALEMEKTSPPLLKPGSQPPM